MKRSLSISAATLVVVAAFASPSLAEIVYSTDSQVGAGSSTASFVPTYNVVSATNLIAGYTPSDSSGSFTVEGSGGLSVLTDGTFGTISAPFTGGNHGLFATGGSAAGKYATYSLDTTSHSAGFNLTSIVVYGGWNDSGRDQQLYTVYYSTVDAPDTFIALETVNYNPSIASGLQSATKVAIYNNSSSILASNVAKIKFDFNITDTGGKGVENGYTGYAEIVVNGVAVPEPSTLALGGAAVGFALLGCLRRFRRR